MLVDALRIVIPWPRDSKYNASYARCEKLLNRWKNSASQCEKVLTTDASQVILTQHMTQWCKWDGNGMQGAGMPAMW
jgi:hypothetical protein